MRLKVKLIQKNAADKARCQKVVDQYLAFQATQKAEAVKRNRSQDENDKPTKKHKVSVHTASIPKPTKRSFNEVARDHLQIALVDEITNRGKPASDKWSEIEARLSRIVVDHVMANPEGHVPGFDSMEVDVTAVEVEAADGVGIILASIYKAHDRPAPPEEARRLVMQQHEILCL
ncbi:uncharacterized protein LOC128870134 [Anastrepha ludens]|uniref:uncharacterized protein LOC128870134 n=1 Tax=Anastrepha ludens TaxID=28586 RepID=UPI0023AF0ECE|nr:uncharacterized protein LOC128870134 [Anastrepha ludens]